MKAREAAVELELVRDTFRSVARANDLKDFNSFISLLSRHGERDANELIRSLAEAIAQQPAPEQTNVPDVQQLVAELIDAGSDRSSFDAVMRSLNAREKSLAALNLAAAGYIGAIKNHRSKKAAILAITDHFEMLAQRARKSREIQDLSGGS